MSTSTIDISNPEDWRKHLGLLPVPLYNAASTRHFVMMNGAQGNFCLDVSDEAVDSSLFRSVAWSSDVGFYLKIIHGSGQLFRWDTSEPGVINTKELSHSLQRFQSLLENNEPQRQRSVIEHALKCFMTLRSTVGSDVDGGRALRLFLLLLACAKDGLFRSQIVPADWGLNSSVLDESRIISDADWDALMRQLTKPLSHGELQLIGALTLRHAAGQLFQEAHYAVSVREERQLVLSGVLRPAGKRIGKAAAVGIYFTPPAIARTIVEQSLALLDIRRAELVIFDPACGSGEFLRETLQQLSTARYQGHLKLIGWDISQTSCDMARFALSKRVTNESLNYSVSIQCVNSLSADVVWPTALDALLMNPPFLSWWDMSIADRELLRANTGDLVSDKPDLSTAFLARSVTALREEGVLGSVIPTSTMEISSTRRLRRRLGEELSPRVIARLGNLALFATAVIDAAIFVGIRGHDDIPATLLWTDQRSKSVSAGLRALRSYQGDPRDAGSYSIYTVADVVFDEDAVEWNPRPYRAFTFFQRQEGLPRTTEVFAISHGVATGLRDAFVVTSDELAALPVKERAYFRPAIVNGSIANGILNCEFYVFYPYANDKVLIGSESAVQRKVPSFYRRFLLPLKDRLQKRKGIAPEKWWLLMRPRDEGSRRPKIVSTYYGQAGSFAYDEKGQYVVVQGLSWRPVPIGNASLTLNELAREDQFQKALAFAYLAILNSEAFELALQATCRRTAGGQIEIAKRFLERAPLPDLFKLDLDFESLDRLVTLGRGVTKGAFPLGPEGERLVASFFA